MRLLSIVSEVICESKMCGVRSPLFGEESEAVKWWNTRSVIGQANEKLTNRTVENLKP